MSKDDVEKAVREAEQFAEEDKKRREEVDLRNSADQMVFQLEKSLGELGDKVSAEEKAEVTAKLDTLKEALKGTDTNAIKKAQEELQQKFYDLSARVYQQQAQQNPGPDMNQAGGGDDNVVDADYREVDNN